MATINYSDGIDTEQHIVDLLDAAVDLASTTDIFPEEHHYWPIRYHLSSVRSNAIRHLNFKGLNVLELGAGMGACSRFIAENAAHLTAVEGTESRMNCLRKRLRDLNNWDGIVSNYQDFHATKKYDVVCFFGVLEYAGRYIDSDNPFEWAIKHAKSFLKEDGVLLITIENKNGLKYFAGLSEDHFLKPYWGICGYPRAHDVQTFSRKEMIDVLAESGLLFTDVHHLAPDYKCARAVVTDEFIKDNPIVAANIMSNHCAENYLCCGGENFPSKLASVSLAKSGLLGEFSNSYLFISSSEKNSNVKKSLLKTVEEEKTKAFSYTHGRKRNVLTRFVKKSGKYVVHKEWGASTPKNLDKSCLIKNVLTDTTPLYDGTELKYLILKHAYYGDRNEMLSLVYDYLDYVFDKYKTDNPSILKKEAFDVIPRNVIVKHGEYMFFDNEYEISFDLTKDYFLFRVVFDLADCYSFLKNFGFGNLQDFYEHLCSKFNITADIRKNAKFEASVQSEIGIHFCRDIDIFGVLRLNLLVNSENLRVSEQNKNAYHYDTNYLNKESRSQYQKDLGSLFSTNTLQVISVPQGVILPIKGDPVLGYKGGVLSVDKEYQELSGWYRGCGVMTTGYDCDAVRFVDQDVIYCGVYIHQWGHFLLESTSRLWYWLSLSPEKRNRYKLAFLCLGQQGPYENMLEFLKLLGIKENDIVNVLTPTQFRSVIIPEQSSCFGKMYTKEFLIPFKEIVKKCPPAAESKIYLSRRRFKENSNTIGEEKIEGFFDQNGFKVIYPETLPLAEQISLMRGAKEVAMLNGSALHNTLFCKSQTRVIVVNRFHLYNNAQLVCDHAKQLRTTYIDGYQTFLPALHGKGPFLVSVTENLIHFAKDHNMKLKCRPGCSQKEVNTYLKMWCETYSEQVYFDLLKNVPVFFNTMPGAFANFFKTQNLRKKSSFWYRVNPFHKRQCLDFSDISQYSDIQVIKKSRLFNKFWYLRHYYADVFKSKLSAEEHYLTIGFKEGKNPSRKFDNDFYLNTYPDIKICGMNPLVHYERFGHTEGRCKRQVNI